LSVQDYRINAEVRRYLVSRWVDVEQLQLGATNGVVYVMGRLDTTLEDPNRRMDEKARREPAARVLHMALMLEREIRRIRDVRDVVFKLENAYKRGGRWRSIDGTTADGKHPARGSGHDSQVGRQGLAEPTATRTVLWNLPEDGSEGADTETDA
jgi:hypothetical protein